MAKNAKMQKLENQVHNLAKAVILLNQEIKTLNMNMDRLTRVAHFHGEPEVAQNLSYAKTE